MLLFIYFISLLLFHMLIFFTQLDRNLLEQKKHLWCLYIALVCTRMAYQYTFFSGSIHTHTHTPVQISQHSHGLLRRNKFTCQFKQGRWEEKTEEIWWVWRSCEIFEDCSIYVYKIIIIKSTDSLYPHSSRQIYNHSNDLQSPSLVHIPLRS